MNKKSIFELYFQDKKFIDRFKKEPKDAVEVIIPIIHTNELWERNLLSIYEEIPVKRLLIGDGGCIDDSLKVLKKFPRVKILNHRKFVSLGYSLKKLIAEVNTDWFIYLHSDVYLPRGWFDQMKVGQTEYDWFESRQNTSVLIDYPVDYANYHRPLSGGQMGRKSSFEKFINKIDDDYLYRNEDMIFADLIKQNGFKYGRTEKAFLYHQIMNKRSAWQRTIKNVSFSVERSAKEEKREWMMQVKGILKYTNPTQQYLIYSLQSSLRQLKSDKNFNFKEFSNWVKKTNPQWVPFIRFSLKRAIIEYTKNKLIWIYNHILK